MKIVSALVGLPRYETKSLTDIHQLKNGRSPQPQSTCKHLKTPLSSQKYRLIIHTGQNPHFAPKRSPSQTTRYIICVKTLNN